MSIRAGTAREIGRRNGDRKVGENVSLFIVNRGRSDLMFGRERTQNFARVFWILKRDSGCAVRADDFSEHAHVDGERTPKSDQLIGDERAGHEYQRETAGQKNDKHQLALDGRIAEEDGHVRV